MNNPITWLSCGVLRAELEELLRTGKITGELRFLDSMLHMVPLTLEQKLIKIIEPNELQPLVLVYGDCCPKMINLVNHYKIKRVNAINCAQMLVGKKRYRELMQEQAFILLPEWASNWKRIFQHGLGLNQTSARELFGENRGGLVYLDTGIIPIPESELAECSDYTGLPVRVDPVILDSLLELLIDAQTRAISEDESEE